MSFFESVIVAAVCMAIVFIVLAALFALIQLLSRILGSAGKGESIVANTAAAAGVHAQQNGAVQAAQEQTAAACDSRISTSVQTSSLKLNNVDERTAAMIMAVVSHETGIPLNELVFRSISLSK